MLSSGNIIRFIALVFPTVVFYIGWARIGPVLEAIFADRETGSLILQATFLGVYFGVVPIVRWLAYLASPKRKIVGYYIEVYERDHRCAISLSRIFRKFFSGTIELYGAAYIVDEHDRIVHEGAWSSSNVVDVSTASSFVDVSYPYRGWVSGRQLGAQVSGITKFSLAANLRGSGYFCDLDKPAPKKTSFYMAKLDGRRILAAIPRKGIWLKKIRYRFSNFLIKDTDRHVLLLDECRQSGWTSRWSGTMISDAMSKMN